MTTEAFKSNTYVGVDRNVQGEGGRQVREKASEVDRGVGGQFKSVWGNLQAITEKGEIFKNYQNVLY